MLGLQGRSWHVRACEFSACLAARVICCLILQGDSDAEMGRQTSERMKLELNLLHYRFAKRISSPAYPSFRSRIYAHLRGRGVRIASQCMSMQHPWVPSLCMSCNIIQARKNTSISGVMILIDEACSAAGEAPVRTRRSRCQSTCVSQDLGLRTAVLLKLVGPPLLTARLQPFVCLRP